MSQPERVRIRLLPTGVPGLDEILGGGLPEYSLNLISGEPGSGKTILTQQILFANATPERRAVYFTLAGEPPVKILRYQQQFSFFDPDKADKAIRFVSLADEVRHGDLGRVLARITQEMEAVRPAFVAVDGFRSVTQVERRRETMTTLEFMQELAFVLTGWQATSFIVMEGRPGEITEVPIASIADGILYLGQEATRNSIVRKLQVVKMRGQAQIVGLHTFRITGDGLQVFPRIFTRRARVERLVPRRRLSTGVPGLDEMMGGGIPVGDAVLVAGPSGSGKTLLGTHFVGAGAAQGEPAVLVIFEEHPEEFVSRASAFGFDPEGWSGQGLLRILYLRPLDLSVDEALYEIEGAIDEIGARRVVIDSVSGFELALAPAFREDFRESLYRLVGSLTGAGVSVLLTVELVESYEELRFSPYLVSFLADDIILLRYAEVAGRLVPVIAVVKMRSSKHSRVVHAFEITDRGLVVGEVPEEYQGILSPVPTLRRRRERGQE